MQIIVNGETRHVEARTLAELCAGLGLGSARIATAVNGEFVAAGARAATPLSENDHIEIVAPRAGG